MEIFKKILAGGGRWLFAALFLLSLQGYGQLSPGPLARVHSGLEGISNCTRCHVLGQKVSSQKCMECHAEIRDRVAAGKGYHASAGVRGKECASCHSDHHGINFQIIRFNRDQFDHSLTGYALKGAHTKRTCTDCHKNALIRDPKVKKKKFTFLGLGTECLHCHDDYHQQTLSSVCTDCHGEESFRPAVRFDHGKSRFQLTGKHRDVPCTACHRTWVRNGLKFQEFKDVRHDNCSDCHTDPHQGRFGRQCSQCHTEQSFSMIRGVENFDHSRTDFPLQGKHAAVACNRCHKTRLTQAMKFDRCTDCHSDHHQGQLARNGTSPDCSECHRVEGFTGHTYGIDQHNRGVFPLRGSHLATPCIACHRKNESGTGDMWRFRQIGSMCVDCHPDIHRPEISDQYYPGSACENCHTESRWSKITFDHTRTDFPLAGAHASQPCRSCHFKKENNRNYQKFNGLVKACSGCHADVHAGQFKVSGETDCNRCHGESAFRPAVRFDHAKTRFPLEGRHAELACDRCHKQLVDKGTTYIFYKIPEFKCENCHH